MKPKEIGKRKTGIMFRITTDSSFYAFHFDSATLQMNTYKTL